MYYAGVSCRSRSAQPDYVALAVFVAVMTVRKYLANKKKVSVQNSQAVKAGTVTQVLVSKGSAVDTGAPPVVIGATMLIYYLFSE